MASDAEMAVVRSWLLSKMPAQLMDAMSMLLSRINWDIFRSIITQGLGVI